MAFSRIGELAAKSATSGGTVVQYSNLRFLTQQGSVCMIKITITNFKRNTAHSPFDIFDILAIMPSSSLGRIL